MDQLPVEVIGNILSCLGEAEDILIASVTCRKWQEAWRNHVHTLSFKFYDDYLDLEMTTSEIEILITETIFQTNGLQCLSILNYDDEGAFSDVAVAAWLRYTRETLRELHFRVPMDVNILERCGRLKLEVLNLETIRIKVVEPIHQKLKCLKSLTLSSVKTSTSALSFVLAACPRIESLNLIWPLIEDSADRMMKLRSCSLKEIYVQTLYIDKFTLEADNLEKLHLTSLTLCIFELIGKGSLKNLRINYVGVGLFNLGENTKNLEVVEITGFTISWSAFYNRIKESLNLKKLRVWNVNFHDKDDILDLGMISMCFPRLIRLSLSRDFMRCDFVDQACLEDLAVLELKVTVSGYLPRFVGVFLEKCPNLKKLVIYGVVSEIKNRQDCILHTKFTSSVMELVRRYMQVQISLEYVKKEISRKNVRLTSFL